MPLITIIGLEIHVQLNTKSKMFCSCANEFDVLSPNKNVCEICLGHPGTLPVANKKAIEYVLKTGLALHCEINKRTKFDRKNYFYPDLPKGYQISQYDLPLCFNGCIEIDGEKIGIERIHLEEDTAKLIHSNKNSETLVDFNRSGAPLMELVTKPDIQTPEQAKHLCQELQRIFRYLLIATADMEKGQMRCEGNISLQEEGKFEIRDGKVQPIGAYALNPKIELKNINSFKAIERALEYEIKRQRKILAEGKTLVQETRGWNDEKNETYHQRAKESAHDYRYFPEPDIPPISISENELKILAAEIPELPIKKRKRFIEEYGIPAPDANILTEEKALSGYAEEVFSEFFEWLKTQEEIQEAEEEKKNQKIGKFISGWITTELFKLINESNAEFNKIKITPENFAEFLTIVFQRQINSTAAQRVLRKMFETGADPTHIIEENDLKQISDEKDIARMIESVINRSPEQVAQYKNGKKNVLMYLVGLVMKESKGRANPEKVQEMLIEKLT